LAAMGEVERLIRAASVKVAAESADGADTRLCLEAYFRELAARFESGFDVGVDDSAHLEDMIPPSGLFLIARLDGDAVGCGGFKRVDKATGEIKRIWTAPSLTEAHALYRSEGYREVARFNDNPYAHHWFEKRL
jgi:hypothetical protein